MVAAPLVGLIPLAALAAMLIVVAWNMTDKDEVWSMIQAKNGNTAVLLATFLLTIFINLLTGIVAGILLHIVLDFVRRRATAG